MLLSQFELEAHVHNAVTYCNCLQQKVREHIVHSIQSTYEWYENGAEGTAAVLTTGNHWEMYWMSSVRDNPINMI